MASSMVLVAKASKSLNNNHNNNNLLLQVSALPGDLVKARYSVEILHNNACGNPPQL